MIPRRISWAIERLGLDGGEAVLEVGCGRGIAAAMIADRLSAGRLVAIDRSATATAAAMARPENRDHVADGRLRILTASLANLAGHDAAFDVVLAINVNVFWLDPGSEMPVVRRVLAPSGRLELFYEPPSSGRAGEAARLVERNLGTHGFDAEVAAFDEAARLLHVTARPRSLAPR